MTVSPPFRRWECDRCGETCETHADRGTPSGWDTIRDRNNAPHVLCFSCRKAWVEFMAALKPKEPLP